MYGQFIDKGTWIEVCPGNFLLNEDNKNVSEQTVIRRLLDKISINCECTHCTIKLSPRLLLTLKRLAPALHFAKSTT